MFYVLNKRKFVKSFFSKYKAFLAKTHFHPTEVTMIKFKNSFVYDEF